MSYPTWDQIKGIVERFVSLGLAALLSWAVIKGWITKEQAKEWGAEYGPIVIMAIATWYGWRINRPKAIVQSAAALPGTVVVTTPAIARATPNEPNIVSNREVSVEPLSEEQITAQLNRDQLR